VRTIYEVRQKRKSKRGRHIQMAGIRELDFTVPGGSTKPPMEGAGVSRRKSGGSEKEGGEKPRKEEMEAWTD